MSNQFINTPGVADAASRIRAANGNINNSFSTLQSRMLPINNWQGAAGSVAQTTMHQLFKMSGVRSSILQNYVNILEQQVNPNYQSAESTNKLLADQFR